MIVSHAAWVLGLCPLKDLVLVYNSLGISPAPNASPQTVMMTSHVTWAGLELYVETSDPEHIDYQTRQVFSYGTLKLNKGVHTRDELFVVLFDGFCFAQNRFKEVTIWSLQPLDKCEQPSYCIQFLC